MSALAPFWHGWDPQAAPQEDVLSAPPRAGRLAPGAALWEDVVAPEPGASQGPLCL